MIKTLLAVGIIVAVATGIAITTLQNTHAATNDNSAIESIREQVLESGIVPDTYLIERTSDHWTGDRQDLNGLKALVGAQSDHESGVIEGRLMIKFTNFATLAETPEAWDPHYVAALVLAQQTISGTYDESRGHVRIYHDYLRDTYTTPNTLSEIRSELYGIVGEMTPLSMAVYEIESEWAARGSPHFDLLVEDPDHWDAVWSLARCQDKGSDCTDEERYLNERLWENIDPIPPEFKEHIDENPNWIYRPHDPPDCPPHEGCLDTQAWTPFQPAYASHGSVHYLTSDMEYSVNTYCKAADREAEGCSFSDAFEEDGYYTDTDLNEPDEHMPGQAAYFRMKVDPQGTASFTYAYVEGTYGGESDNDQSHRSNSGAIVTASAYVGLDDYASGTGWYYYIDRVIGYALQ